MRLSSNHEIRRREDGSIDVPHYEGEALAMRQRAMNRAVMGLVRGLVRGLVTTPARIVRRVQALAARA